MSEGGQQQRGGQQQPQGGGQQQQLSPAQGLARALTGIRQVQSWVELNHPQQRNVITTLRESGDLVWGVIERMQQQQQQQQQQRSSRKPEQVEVTSPRLYVGNLSFDATESDLFELFNGVGKVQNAEVVTYKHNQRSKGFAFVQMQSVEEARRAVTELHDKEFLGRKLLVSGAKSNDRPSDS